MEEEEPDSMDWASGGGGEDFDDNDDGEDDEEDRKSPARKKRKSSSSSGTSTTTSSSSSSRKSSSARANRRVQDEVLHAYVRERWRAKKDCTTWTLRKTFNINYKRGKRILDEVDEELRREGHPPRLSAAAAAREVLLDRLRERWRANEDCSNRCLMQVLGVGEHMAKQLLDIVTEEMQREGIPRPSPTPKPVKSARVVEEVGEDMREYVRRRWRANKDCSQRHLMQVFAIGMPKARRILSEVEAEEETRREGTPCPSPTPRSSSSSTADGRSEDSIDEEEEHPRRDMDEETPNDDKEERQGGGGEEGVEFEYDHIPHLQPREAGKGKSRKRRPKRSYEPGYARHLIRWGDKKSEDAQLVAFVRKLLRNGRKDDCTPWHLYVMFRVDRRRLKRVIKQAEEKEGVAVEYTPVDEATYNDVKKKVVDFVREQMSETGTCSTAQVQRKFKVDFRLSKRLFQQAKEELADEFPQGLSAQKANRKSWQERVKDARRTRLARKRAYYGSEENEEEGKGKDEVSKVADEETEEPRNREIPRAEDYLEDDSNAPVFRQQ